MIRKHIDKYRVNQAAAVCSLLTPEAAIDDKVIADYNALRKRQAENFGKAQDLKQEQQENPKSETTLSEGALERLKIAKEDKVKEVIDLALYNDNDS